MDLLYKYRPFDLEPTCQNERTLQMLRDRKVWMASPASFNDPFDCQPSILRNLDAEQIDLETIIRNYLGRINLALRTGSTLMDVQGNQMPHRTLVELKQVIKSPRPNEAKYKALKKYLPVPPDSEAAFEVLKNRLANVGVLSLSASPAEMLMWAHYASQHRGFCLGFERAEETMLANELHTKPVRYMDAYPELSLSTIELSWSVTVQHSSISDSMEIDIGEPHLQSSIYSKSTQWAREEEWRVLVAKGSVLAEYPGPLRMIIFGLRCDPATRKLIENAVQKSPSGAEVHFAEIQSKPGSFDLMVQTL